MSRLDELIQELCPDGVEYKKIGDVCKTLSPSVKIKSNDYLENGLYPVIDQGQDFIGGYTNESSFPKDEYVIFGDHTCVVKYVDFAFVQGADGVKVLAPIKSIIIPKFLYYCMDSIQMDVSYARHWSKMKEKEVPVPPLEVQREIVRVLDHFTLLRQELSAELSARRKQYEYYRDELLTFDDDAKNLLIQDLMQRYCPDGVEYKPLGDFAHFSVERVDADDMDAENYVSVDNLLPDKQGKTISDYVPEEGKVIAFHEGDILIGNIRPYLKKIWRATHDGGTNGDVLVICSDNSVDSGYLFYCLSSDMFFHYDMQHAKGAKMPRGDKGAIMQFEVPVPPLPVQREIIRILDCFTELTAELSAELTARRKQYEYYRDELLVFKRKDEA